jgi:hypothetical protein
MQLGSVWLRPDKGYGKPLLWTAGPQHMYQVEPAMFAKILLTDVRAVAAGLYRRIRHWPEESTMTDFEYLMGLDIEHSPTRSTRVYRFPYSPLTRDVLLAEQYCSRSYTSFDQALVNTITSRADVGSWFDGGQVTPDELGELLTQGTDIFVGRHDWHGAVASRLSEIAVPVLIRQRWLLPGVAGAIRIATAYLSAEAARQNQWAVCKALRTVAFGVTLIEQWQDGTRPRPAIILATTLA